MCMMKAKQNAEVVRLQSAVLQSTRTTKWQPMDDTKVQHQLAEISSSIIRVVKEHAFYGTQSVSFMSTNSFNELFAQLGDFGVTRWSGTYDLIKIFDMRSGARLCLTG